MGGEGPSRGGYAQLHATEYSTWFLILFNVNFSVCIFYIALQVKEEPIFTVKFTMEPQVIIVSPVHRSLTHRFIH